MASFVYILCALCLLHETFGSPAVKTAVSVNTKTKASDDTSEDNTGIAKINEETFTGTLSLGTHQFSDNLEENLMKSMNNMRTGAAQMSTPIVKFGGDTVPNLFTSGFKTMANSATKIVDANKKGFRKLVNGAGSLLGGGAIFGSSVVGGNMQLLGSGLGVAGNMMEAAAKFGLDITGNLADTTALSNMLFSNLINNILKGLGNGMNTMGDGVTVLSKGSAKLIDALGNSVSHSIGNAQNTIAKWFKNGSAKIEDGTMTLTSAAQVNYYNALQWYLKQLLEMENMMDKLTEAINSEASKTPSSGTKVDDKKEDTTTDIQ